MQRGRGEVRKCVAMGQTKGGQVSEWMAGCPIVIQQRWIKDERNESVKWRKLEVGGLRGASRTGLEKGHHPEASNSNWGKGRKEGKKRR